MTTTTLETDLQDVEPTLADLARIDAAADSDDADDDVDLALVDLW